MGDPRAVGAPIRMKLPCLTPPEGKVAADIPARMDIGETTPLREIAEIGAEDTAGEIFQKVFRTVLQALEETFAILDLEAFDRAADCLARARQRDFYGLGGAAQIARDVSHTFLRVGIRSSVFDDAHMMMMSAALLGPGDVAIAVSHSGPTSAVLDAAEMAQRDRKAADANLSRTMRAVQSKRRV